MMSHRRAGSDDLAPVFDLYMDESGNPFLTYDPMSRENFKEIFEKLLQSQTLFVVEENGSVIATYRLIPKTDRQSHTLYLGGFTIQKQQQGKGIGTQVLQQIASYAISQQKSRIELTVDINNEAAIALYKKVGFLIEGRIRNSYRRSDTGHFYDEYLMGLVW